MATKGSWTSNLPFRIFKKSRISEKSLSSDENIGRNSENSSESSSGSENKTEFGLQDFEVLRKLGHGGFGRVFLAQSKVSKKLVALKVIVKKEIPETKTDREHVVAEHFCLTHFGYPFLVRLHCSFQTPTKLFYATEFLQGGELFSWMEKFGKFSRVS